MNQYNVETSDDETITLKDSMVQRMSTVVIPRDRIASVRKVMNSIEVETTGGARYWVLPGVRRKQKEKSRAAFEPHGITIK